MSNEGAIKNFLKKIDSANNYYPNSKVSVNEHKFLSPTEKINLALQSSLFSSLEPGGEFIADIANSYTGPPSNPVPTTIDELAVLDSVQKVMSLNKNSSFFYNISGDLSKSLIKEFESVRNKEAFLKELRSNTVGEVADDLVPFQEPSYRNQTLLGWFVDEVEFDDADKFRSAIGKSNFEINPDTAKNPLRKAVLESTYSLINGLHSLTTDPIGNMRTFLQGVYNYGVAGLHTAIGEDTLINLAAPEFAEESKVKGQKHRAGLRQSVEEYIAGYTKTDGEIVLVWKVATFLLAGYGVSKLSLSKPGLADIEEGGLKGHLGGSDQGSNNREGSNDKSSSTEKYPDFEVDSSGSQIIELKEEFQTPYSGSNNRDTYPDIKDTDLPQITPLNFTGPIITEKLERGSETPTSVLNVSISSQQMLRDISDIEKEAYSSFISREYYPSSDEFPNSPLPGTSRFTASWQELTSRLDIKTGHLSIENREFRSGIGLEIPLDMTARTIDAVGRSNVKSISEIVRGVGYDDFVAAIVKKEENPITVVEGWPGYKISKKLGFTDPEIVLFKRKTGYVTNNEKKDVTKLPLDAEGAKSLLRSDEYDRLELTLSKQKIPPKSDESLSPPPPFKSLSFKFKGLDFAKEYIKPGKNTFNIYSDYRINNENKMLEKVDFRPHQLEASFDTVSQNLKVGFLIGNTTEGVMLGSLVDKIGVDRVKSISGSLTKHWSDGFIHRWQATNDLDLTIRKSVLPKVTDSMGFTGKPDIFITWGHEREGFGSWNSKDGRPHPEIVNMKSKDVQVYFTANRPQQKTK